MAHDVLWRSMCIDHPDEIAVYMEDGRNPGGSEAGNTGSRTWPCSCGASSPVVSASVTARKDDAPAAVQAAIVTVAGLGLCSVGGGLIQTTSG